MKEVNIDMFDYAEAVNADGLVVTTNGYLKKDGSCVMGRGCAYTANKKYKGAAEQLGHFISIKGNQVFVIHIKRRCSRYIFSFPTKPSFGDNPMPRYAGKRADVLLSDRKLYPGWMCFSSIELIKESTRNLVKLVNIIGCSNIVMPRPGCGNGGLKWKEVRPILKEYLDNRFTVCHFKKRGD